MAGKISEDSDKVVDGTEKLAAASGPVNYGILISSIKTWLQAVFPGVTKNQNATTEIAVVNTDTTDGNSRAQFKYLAGSVNGRLFAQHSGGVFFTCDVAASITFQIFSVNQLIMDGTTVAAQKTLTSPASATGAAGFRLIAGVAPTSPVNGDIWQDGTNLKIRIGGVTKTVTLV